MRSATRWAVVFVSLFCTLTAMAQTRIVPQCYVWTNQPDPPDVDNDSSFVNMVRINVRDTADGDDPTAAAHKARLQIIADIAAGKMSTSTVCIVHMGFGNDDSAAS